VRLDLEPDAERRGSVIGSQICPTIAGSGSRRMTPLARGISANRAEFLRGRRRWRRASVRDRIGRFRRPTEIFDFRQSVLSIDFIDSSPESLASRSIGAIARNLPDDRRLYRGNDAPSSWREFQTMPGSIFAAIYMERDMNKVMLMGGAALLTLSGAAIAQTAAAPSEPAPDMSMPVPAEAPDAATTTASAASAAAPAPAATADASVTPAPAAPAEPASQTASAAPATPPAVSADAAAKVNAEWAKYDEGNKGKLTPLEFGSWVLAAKGQDQTAQVEKTKTSKKAGLPAVKVLNATATDFAKADSDKDRMISPNELASFLSA
jgi:hypothetical protein